MRDCLQLRGNLMHRPWRHVAVCISLHENTLAGDAGPPVGGAVDTRAKHKRGRGRGHWDKGCEEWEEWRNSERYKKANVPLEPPSPDHNHTIYIQLLLCVYWYHTLPFTCTHSLFEIDYIKHFERICWHTDRLNYVSMVTNISQWNGVTPPPPPTICKMKVGVRD